MKAIIKEQIDQNQKLIDRLRDERSLQLQTKTIDEVSLLTDNIIALIQTNIILENA